MASSRIHFKICTITFRIKKENQPTYLADLLAWPKGGGPRVGLVVSTAAFHARVWGSFPGLGCLKETKMFLPHPRVELSIVGSLRDREVACSASDRQDSVTSFVSPSSGGSPGPV